MYDRECGTCFYAGEVKDPAALGREVLACRCNPPQVVLIIGPQGSGLMTIYPTISPDFPACGDYELKEGGDGDAPTLVDPTAH